MADKLKEIFFNENVINNMAVEISKKFKKFQKEDFIKAVYNKDWENKELKEKMHHVTICLYEFLPKNYLKALEIILQIAPTVNGFEGMCLPNYVEKYGLEFWNESLSALKELTKYSSSEFAIRPFIIKDKVKAMQYMLKLSKSSNEHVRRFSSEGCRPRLPWAVALSDLKKDPSLIIPVLENLKKDSSEYVRKSVANNLNDISKEHPDLVVNLCKKWKGISTHTDWIIKRACRTLLKKGNKNALMIFGYTDPNFIKVNNLTFNNSEIKIGNDYEFNFSLIVEKEFNKKIRIEYAMDFVKKSGKNSSKVFMIKEAVFNKGTHELSKKHSFKEMTTRKHFPGKHYLSIIVNGEQKIKKAFMLLG